MKSITFKLLIGTFLCVSTLKAQVSGTFTVGVGGNYLSLTEAYDSLKSNTVNGTVVLLIISDLQGTQTFNGRVAGLNDTNRIIITSSTANANSFTIGTSVNTYALYLNNGVSYVSFKDISIGETSNSNQNYGIYFEQCNASYTNLEFNRCKINTYLLTTSNTAYAAVYYKGLNNTSCCANNIRFVNNTLRGGYYNMYMYYAAGSDTGMFNRTGFTIDSNFLLDAYYAGIYSHYYAFYHSVSYNKITTSANSSEYNGIYTNTYTTIDSLIGNRIHINIPGTAYGLRMYKYQNYNLNYGAVGPMFIANNEIMIHCSASYGIYLYGSSYYSQFDVFHNSLFISGTANCHGLYWYPRDSNYTATFINNNVHIHTPDIAYLFRYGSTNYMGLSYSRMDYNNYYSSNNLATTYYGYGSNAYKTLSLWKSAKGQDANSDELPLYYVDSTISLALINYNGLNCPVKAGVYKDIQNNPRGSITYKGCYAPYTGDVAIENVTASLSGGATNQAFPINIQLINKGLDTLRSATISWIFQDVLQPSFAWTGSLPPEEDTVICIGSVFLTAGNNNGMKLWAGNPNGLNDNELDKDTLSLCFYGCDSLLEGVYTVGGGGSDFLSIAEALMDLRICGIKGNVKFLLNPGVNNDILICDSITGLSDTNTITFTSATGNAGSVVFEATTGIALTLDNVKNLIFKNITINAQSGTNAIEFRNNCRNITFYECNIYADSTAVSVSKNAVAYQQQAGDSTYLSNVCFIKNNISGGYANFYFQYVCGNYKNMPHSSICIDSNVLTNAYYCGIYSNHYVLYQSISYNMITTRQANTIQYAMYLDNYNTVTQGIIGNRIKLLSTSGAYGIRMSNINRSISYGASGNALIANNEIRIMQTGTTNYGLYIHSVKADIYNNSFYISSANNAYGLYIALNGTNYGMNIQNNMIYTGGLNTGYPIYTENLSYVTRTYNTYIDNNNYYSTTGSIAYVAENISSLLSWQTLTAQDTHSVFKEPIFINANISLKLSDYQYLLCKRLPRVMTDINGENRTVYTTMGAYGEVIDMQSNLSLNALIEPVNTEKPTCYQDYASVRVEIINTGNIDYDFSYLPLFLHLDVQGAITMQSDTVISAGLLKSTQKDTVCISDLLPLTLKGVYQITVTLKIASDINPLDDTLRSTYEVKKINIPYHLNFNTQTNDIVFTHIAGYAKFTIESGKGSNPVISPSHGTGRLQFSSSMGEGSLAIAKLQPLDLKGLTDPKLKFWYAHDDANPTKADFTEVKISVDGGETFQSLLYIERYDSAYAIPTFVCYTVDLSSFTEYSCVILVFEAGSCGGGNQNIDSIAIVTDYDIALILTDPDLSDARACEIKEKTFKLCLKNLSSHAFDFSKYPSSIQLNIKDAHLASLTYPLQYQIIPPDSSLTIEIIKSVDFSTNGEYYIEAFINAIDAYTNNDTAKVSFYVMTDVKIINMDSIHMLESGEKAYPTIYIINAGNIPVHNIPVTFAVNDIEISYETINELLNPEDTLVYRFKQGFSVPPVDQNKYYYQVKTKVVLSCDGEMNNNSFILNACIKHEDEVRQAKEKQVWSLNQNVPNPASNETMIVFTLPKDGYVKFNLHSQNGQLIYQQNIYGKQGENFLKLNTKDFHSGIYYYGMEYDGYIRKNKMIIIKK